MEDVQELGLFRKVLHGLGAYILTNWIITGGGFLGLAAGTAVNTPMAVLVFFLIGWGSGIWLAVKYREYRLYESTKTWITVAIVLNVLMFIVALFGGP